MPTSSELLDLPRYIGQRSVSFRFELFNGTTGVVKDELTPFRGTAPTLAHDTTATISRRLSNLVLTPADTARIEPLTDRIKVSMVIGDRARTTFPLGRYMVADDITAQRSSGNIAALTWYDEMFIVDQKMPTGFDADGEKVDQAILRLLDGLPIGDILIEASDQVSTNSWSAGTARGRVLLELCNVGGYFKPWFDNQGRLRIVRAFDPSDRVPDIDLDDPPRIARDSIGRSDDLLTAPNQWVVIANNDSVDEGAVPVVGVYNVPSSAPHSYARRGFLIPDVREVQVVSQSQASVYARALGLQQDIFERADLDTPLDPRHDGYDVIRFDGELWLELAWSMQLKANGMMGHQLRRAFPHTGEDEEILL